MAYEASGESTIEMTSPSESTNQAHHPASTSLTAGEASQAQPANSGESSVDESNSNNPGTSTTSATRRGRHFSSSASRSNTTPCHCCCTCGNNNEPLQDSRRQQTVWWKFTGWLWSKGKIILTAILSSFSAVFTTMQFYAQRAPALVDLGPRQRWHDNLDYSKWCAYLKEKGEVLDKDCQERLATSVGPPPTNSSSSSSKARRDNPQGGSVQQSSFTQLYSSYISGPLAKLRKTIDEAKRKFVNEIGDMRELRDFLNNPERSVGGGAAIPRRRQY